MNLITLFKLLSKGLNRAGPTLEEEAKRIEDEEARRNNTKNNVCRDFKCVLHLDNALEISRWQREEGRGVDVGKFSELEIWQRDEYLRLAVKKNEEWEVYVILADITSYQLRRRLV